jgi:hypothetical protein
LIGTFKNHPNGRSGRHEVELKIIRFQAKTHKSSSIGPQDVDWEPADSEILLPLRHGEWEVILAYGLIEYLVDTSP